MKKTLFLILIMTTSFCLGYVLHYIISHQNTQFNMNKENSKVTGIGGVFFKCKDPQKVNEWYKAHLGLNTNPYGAVFEWHQGANPTQKGFTQWSPFEENTDYFEPSNREFMINYRVVNIETLVDNLKANGVTVLDAIETYNYGKFVHILDIEGNKIELWEPYDVEYEKLGIEMGFETTK